MFGKGITLFRLFGFRVKLDASWVLLALLVAWTLADGLFPTYLPGLPRRTYWLLGVVGVVGLLFSIIIHEFSHSLVARHYGLPMGGIQLFLFGGVAEMEEEPPSAKSELLMALAGPASSVVLAALFQWLHYTGVQQGWSAIAVVLFFYLAYLNGVLAIFNLLPAFPLDGGRVLRAVLWGTGKNIQRATRTASSIGQGFGTLLMALGVVAAFSGSPVSGLWWIMIGLFLRAAAEGSYGQLRLRETVQGLPVRNFMTAPVITVPEGLNLRDFYEGYLYHSHHRLYPVVEGERLVGCLYVKSMRDTPRAEWDRHRVAQFMVPCDTRNSVDADEDAAHALRIMFNTGNIRLVVTENDRLAGVITLHDIAAAVAQERRRDRQ